MMAAPVNWEAETIAFIRRASLLEIIEINRLRFIKAHKQSPPLVLIASSLRGQIVFELSRIYGEIANEFGTIDLIIRHPEGTTQYQFATRKQLGATFLKLLDVDNDLEVKL
jgi:hypothetical protein